MSISLLFLTYNRKGIVARCLRSLVPTLKRSDIEWIILDNGSTDGTSEWLLKMAASYQNIRVELQAQNLGVSGGRARLMEIAKGDILVFLDSDVEARHPEWLDNLIAPLDQKTVGICGQGGHWITDNWQWYEPVAGAGFVDTVSGYCQAFRRDVIKEGMVIDTQFGRYWHEDTDWCLQIKDQGYDVWCTGDIGLHHIFTGSGDNGKGHTKQKYLASKWQGKGLVRHEQVNTTNAKRLEPSRQA